MSNKIVAYDGLNARDLANISAESSLKTSIDIRDHETGKIIFKGLKNKVIIAGSGLLAKDLFDLPSTHTEVTPTYNTKLGCLNVEGELNTDVSPSATAKYPKILLFCIGTDGCGESSSQVYPVDYTKWISNPIPFRYPIKENDISDDLRNTYFGRVESTDKNHYAYYFKRFEGEPKIVQQYTDGTLITKDSNIYESSKTVPAETYVEITLKITKEDLREYFIATSNIDNAKFNSISLCYAYPVIGKDGYTYFNDIRPMTKLNIPNEPMIDITKGIDIIYHIYM